MVWEQRWHPLREEWVIIAAHRQDRPWTGEKVPRAPKEIPVYDLDCYLCPGNKRVSGKKNPDYEQTFVFDNDHACVSWNAPTIADKNDKIYRIKPAHGLARVVCYSPQHNLTLAELELPQVVTLLNVWQEQYRELAGYQKIKNVLIFENKGEMVGVSNPHPHCQIYATNFVFKYIETEVKVSRAHYRKYGRVLFQDIIRREREDGRRIICENNSAIAFIPYFARYAYEIYVAPKETYTSLADLSAEALLDFVQILKEVLIKYDNLWKMPFPYVMPLHQAPTDKKDYSGFHFHIEFHPPLRKPNLQKYLAGPEIGGGNFLSDTSPEEKAAEIRNQPDVHFKLLKR
jgi:UDPglucose--hexose-1-phosphate uridylyltransferase